jgi:hypothetical protein
LVAEAAGSSDMIRYVGSLALILLAGTAFAQSEGCVFEKQPSKDGHFGALSLQSYGTRWEMQIETPSQAVTLDAGMLIDGARQEVEILGGLDDMVVTVSDIPGTLDLTEDLLERLAGGHRVTILAKVGGETVTASYELGGSRKAIEFMRENCNG